MDPEAHEGSEDSEEGPNDLYERMGALDTCEVMQFVQIRTVDDPCTTSMVHHVDIVPTLEAMALELAEQKREMTRLQGRINELERKCRDAQRNE